MSVSQRTVSCSIAGPDGARLSAIVEAPHAFRVLAAGWSADGESVRGPAVRVSADGTRWSSWRPIREDRHDGEAGGSRRFGGLVSFEEDMRFLQVRVEPGQDEGGAGEMAPPDASVAITFIRPSSSRHGLPPIGRGFHAAGAEGAGMVAKPRVVSRAAWGCPDGADAPLWPPRTSEVGFLVVHHTAGADTSTNWAESVQAIWAFHTFTRGWGDIGYNFLIAPNGVIYEGRAGGDDAVGAHFSCANAGTLGIGMLGNFTDKEPTAAALASLRRLLAWKACKEGIDPVGVGVHEATGLALDRISGHRDANASTAAGACPSGTVCPGSSLHAILPEIRADVAALIEAGGVESPVLALASVAIDDAQGNRDGVANPGETLGLSVTLRNDGPAAATAIHGVMDSDDPFVTLIDGANPWRELRARGDADDEIGDFDLVVAAETPHGHEAILRLMVTAAEGEWTFSITVPVVAPGAGPGGFAAWAASAFPHKDADNHWVVAPASDPDGDGLANVVEYALALDPLVAAPADLRAGTIVVGRERFPTLTFRRRPAPDLAFSLERLIDGSPEPAWEDDPALTVPVGSPVPLPDGTERATLRGTVPLEDVPRQVLRLRVRLSDDR